MPVGTVHVQKFADVIESETELRCPSCNGLPKYAGGYTCTCGSVFNHWSKLVRILKATGEKIVKTKFTSDGEPVNANAYVMDSEEFAKYTDATLDETILINLKSCGTPARLVDVALIWIGGERRDYGEKHQEAPHSN